MAGTYTLLVRLARPDTIRFGAAGDRELPAGWYAYVGSAFGPGGFARIDRHRDVATGCRTTRHWHVDYLLGHTAAALDTVVRSPRAAIECQVATRLAGRAVEGVGATDCDCGSHLVRGTDRSRTLRDILNAHTRASR